MKSAWLFAMLLAVVVAPGATAGDLVVIASTTAAYPPGTIVTGTSPVLIPAGDSITLVSSSGKSLRLVGPSSAPPEPRTSVTDTGLLEALAHIVAPPDASTTRLAVFRGGPSQRPDLWSVNTERDGTYCVFGDSLRTLWRKHTDAVSTATVEAPDGGSGEVRWNNGARLADWPAGLAASDGGHYLLRWFDGDSGRRFELRLIPPTLPSDAHRAAWMHAHGCVRQAQALIADIATRGE